MVVDKIMEYVLSKRNDHLDWKPNTGHSYNEESQGIKPRVCSSCGRSMTRRPNKFKEGTFWWGCSGYPKCKYTEKE